MVDRSQEKPSPVHPVLRRQQMQSVNRRTLLKGLVSLPAAGVLAGCTGGQGGADTLRVAAPTIALPQEPRGAKKFQELYDVELRRKSVSGSPSDIVSLFVAGDGQDRFDALWDNGGLDDNGMEDLLREEGVIQPIDNSEISNWDALHTDFKKGGIYSGALRYPTNDGMELVAVPSVRNVDSVAYVKSRAPEPDSFGAIFDNDEFMGQTAIVNDYSVTPLLCALYMNSAGLADIEKPNNMTEDEIETVIDFLIERKQAGQFKTIWQSFQESVNLLVNEEVAYMYTFESAVIAAQEQGADVGYPPLPETGGMPWADNWLMTKGAVDRGREGAFYELANWALSEVHGADMIQTRGYLSGIQTDRILSFAEDNSENYDVGRIRNMIEQKKERYEVSSKWGRLNVAPDNLSTYQDEWQRFLNA